MDVTSIFTRHRPKPYFFLAGMWSTAGMESWLWNPPERIGSWLINFGMFVSWNWICYENFIGDKKNHGCSETGLANDSEEWAYHFFCCFGNFSMNSGSCRRKWGVWGCNCRPPGPPVLWGYEVAQTPGGALVEHHHVSKFRKSSMVYPWFIIYFYGPSIP
jgi:hypothetical protein